MTDHPITPPPELVRQWDSKAVAAGMPEQLYIATQAARWGADQELQACCDAIYKYEGEPLCGGTAEWLRNAMSPKPPSLKEQALRILVENGTTLDGRVELDRDDIAIINRALEALSDD